MGGREVHRNKTARQQSVSRSSRHHRRSSFPSRHQKRNKNDEAVTSVWLVGCRIEASFGWLGLAIHDRRRTLSRHFNTLRRRVMPRRCSKQGTRHTRPSRHARMAPCCAGAPRDRFQSVLGSIGSREPACICVLGPKDIDRMMEQMECYRVPSQIPSD